MHVDAMQSMTVAGIKHEQRYHGVPCAAGRRMSLDLADWLLLPSETESGRAISIVSPPNNSALDVFHIHSQRGKDG